MVAAGCFSRVRTRASEALAWALLLLLAPLVTGGLGAGRRVTCRTLSSTLAGGITSPSTQSVQNQIMVHYKRPVSSLEDWSKDLHPCLRTFRLW